MKSDKTKLHQHRKTRKAAVAHATHEAHAELTDLDLMLYRIERSPKQENL